MAHRHVERFGGDVLLGAIRKCPFDTGVDRLDDRRMEQRGLRSAAQRERQRLRLLGDDVETEGLDGDEPIAAGFVSAEYGTKRADANLVQHSERAESRRR